MTRTKILAAAIAALISAEAAVAQSNGIPAEYPPADFTGNQYVDSEGCAFIRAGISGIVDWVPRVDRSRNQLCNFQPTFADAPEPEAVPLPADAPVVDLSGTESVPADASQEVATEIVAEPAAVAESNDTETETADTDSVAVVTPVARTVTTRATAAPVPAPARPAAPAAAARPSPVAAPGPVRLTKQEVCAGKTGPQPGYISSLTGETLDCGSGTESSALRRLTRAQACAEMEDRGVTLIDQATGAPVACAPAASSAATLRTGAAVPASNPSAVTAPATTVPSGYRPVWSDGRINPQRGLPSAAPDQAASTQSTSAHRYVQVGSFADHSNAERLIARLSAQGHPVATGRTGALKDVAVGPFTDGAALNAALQSVRRMGFSDAFLRR